jgi:polar amino acid transport system substrate-binding protein
MPPHAARFAGTRRRVLAVLLAATCLTAGAPAIARPLDEVTASGVLRVAVYGDNVPFSGEGAAGPRGIDVDIARAIADRLKLRLDLRVVDAGETVDGDFRLNLWRGDLAGSPLADLMLHVPHDRVLATRNLEGHAVAVEGMSGSDSIVMNAEGGRYRASVKHYRSFDEAAKAYLAGEAPILAGTRAGIEAAIAAAGASRGDNPVVEVPMPGIVRTRWDLGGAVRSDSRDLAYAVGDALSALAAEGRLKAICDAYGVTYAAPQGY